MITKRLLQLAVQFVFVTQIIEVCFVDVPRGANYVIDTISESHVADLLMAHSNAVMRYVVSR